METLGKAFVVAALVLGLVGVALLGLSRFGLTRLPGDILIRGKNVTVYAPVGVMILISLVLTIVLNLIWRR
jgi:hypothetical protein